MNSRLSYGRYQRTRLNWQKVSTQVGLAIILAGLTSFQPSMECREWAPGMARIGALASAQAQMETPSPPAGALQEFLASDWLNPFSKEVSLPEIESRTQLLAREVVQTFETVVAMENRLIESENALRASGFHTPAEFLGHMARLVESLPAEAGRAIQASPEPHELFEKINRGEAPFQGEEAQRLREAVSSARSQLQDHFQEKRIEHTKSYFRLALGLGALNVYDLAIELRRGGTILKDADRIRYEKLFSKLSDLGKQYLANESLYEGPKRNMAVTPHNDYLRALKKLSSLADFLQQAEMTSREVASHSQIGQRSRMLSHAVWNYIKRFFHAVLAAPIITYNASKVIWSIARHNTYQPDVKGQSSHGDLAIPNSVMEITRQMTPILNLKVEIEGREKLSTLAPDAVAILTPTHRDALRDMIAVASLRFKNMAMYANAGQIMNMIFGRRDTIEILGKSIDMLAFKRRVVGEVNRNPGVLVAGPTHNPDRENLNFKPVTKGIRLMIDGVQQFLNYPHGALPSHLGVDLPIVESWFGPKATLAEAWRAGYSPNLIVATFPYNVDPLNLGLIPEHGRGIVKVRIDGVVPGDLIKTLTAFGGEPVLRHLFEANSNLGMVSGQHLHRGHIRSSSLPEMIDRYMQFPRSRTNSESTMLKWACESSFVPL